MNPMNPMNLTSEKGEPKLALQRMSSRRG